MMIAAKFKEIKNSEIGQVVNPEVLKTDEEIQKEAIEFIERKMGFKVKERRTFKSTSFNTVFELEYKEYNLKPKDWHKIFNTFVDENEERPIVNKTKVLSIIIDEYIGGFEKGTCPKCGEKLFEHGIYCVYCGEKLLSRYRLD